MQILEILCYNTFIDTRKNIMWKYSESNLGEFVEQEYGNTFTYKEVSEYNPYGVTHEIDVLDGTRLQM